MAKKFAEKTISSTITTRITGGRTESERINTLFIDTFVIMNGIKLEGTETFFERLGKKPPHREELYSMTPYSFVIKHGGSNVRCTMDDNVIIINDKTVLKFLSSKKNVKGFLLSMYIANVYSDVLGLAKCTAYYPELMCAEYEYIGENVDTINPQSTLEYAEIYSQIQYILNDIEKYAKMKPEKSKPFNFCINESREVKMTCTKWLVPIEEMAST